jgi:uncharacterized protein YjbI with pentapeptide repeats
VQQQFETIYGAGGLRAQYSVKLDVNGYVAGFGLYNEGAGASGFIVRADKFVVGSAGSNVVPFEVVSGITYIKNAVIQDGTITAAKIATLNADKITAGTIGAQTISLNGSSSILRSSNYVAGSAGWQIRGDGVAEFASAAIRGTLTADRISGGTLNFSTFTASNISASSINTGTLNGTNVTVTNLNATNITTGTLNGVLVGSGVSGSNITTGTLNASLVNVTNLNASNINTGNLSATRISGGTLNAGTITVTNLRADSITVGTLTTGQISDGAISSIVANSITPATIYPTSGAWVSPSFSINMNANANRGKVLVTVMYSGAGAVGIYLNVKIRRSDNLGSNLAFATDINYDLPNMAVLNFVDTSAPTGAYSYAVDVFWRYTGSSLIRTIHYSATELKR